MMILVTGSSASGKSAFAEKRLMDMGEKKRIYAACMIAWDEECKERIRRHRAMRKGKKFETRECPMDLENLKIPEKSAVLLECMSNLAANELYRKDMGAGMDISVRGPKAAERILRGLYKIRSEAEDLVVVTNEVFSDMDLYDRETKEYRRLLGKLNQELFRMADEAWEMVYGIPMCLKGEQNTACGREDEEQRWMLSGCEDEKERRMSSGCEDEKERRVLSGCEDEKERRMPSGCEDEKGRRMPSGRENEEEQRMAGWREDKGVHMRLIVGGAHQGKKEAALKILGREMETAAETMADGGRDSFDAALKGKLILNFHEYIRRFSFLESEEARSNMCLFLERLKKENPAVTVISDEIGCGIVPVAKEDRLWRDLLGEALQDLAGESDEVYRVICGCVQTLKGEMT